MLSQTIIPKTKNDLIKSIQNKTIKEMNVYEVSSQNDMKGIVKSIDSVLKRGSVSIVVIR